MVRIGFIGCHEISWSCLKKICELCIQYKDNLVIAFNLTPIEAAKHSASKGFENLQKRYNFSLYNVENVAHDENIQILNNAKLNILFIIGWHRIVPQTVLDTTKIRLGIHSSLLPKDRGASPINWQIIRGESKGGITLFHLTTGIDAGDIVNQEEYEITENDDVKSVYHKATLASISLLEKNWPQIHSLDLKSVPQKENEVTVNKRRKPSDGLIDWKKSSRDCFNWIRSLTSPYPGAFTYWGGKRVFIWKSNLIKKKETEPGQLIQCDDRILISTGHNCLELLLLQIEGEPLCDAKLFSKTYNLRKGDYFSATNSTV